MSNDKNPAQAFISAEDIGEAMSALRGGETQKECADRAGLDRASWNQYENGKAFPKHENIQRIAQGLGVEVADFTVAVIQAWSIRMDRHPFAEFPQAGVYDFTVRGQIELTGAMGHGKGT